MQVIEKLRHSLSHLLAAAVLEIYPDAKPTLGPPVENGFYYDFDMGEIKITPENLKKIEKRMKKLLPHWTAFSKIDVTSAEAKQIYADNPYKLELIEEIAKSGEDISLYYSGPEGSIPSKEDILNSSFKIHDFAFVDLCRGGHVDNPAKDINKDAFNLDRLAGAYWRGDEKNKMLTRIYGLAFENKEELENYKKQREEAAKRDHKKLGKELDLFTFSDLVGPGLPMFLPKGETIFHELDKYMRQEKEKRGYSFVHIPHIAKTELYKKSGHLGKYDAMMPIMTDEEENKFVMKAMNCPHHFEIFNSKPHSYRDLPLRLAENTTVYRNEKSGELSGLVRVKTITQDDTHHFVRHDQIQSEIEMILGLMDEVYKKFDFTDYTVQISIRDPKAPENYFGDDKLWSKSEEILIEAVKKWGRPYIVEEGEAAFYGPKIDIMVKDSIGRDWQLTTVQLDFNQPENFNMRYVGEDGEEHAPAVLHVAVLGSIERFMGVLIEHYAGAFPFWLSPIQIKVLPISDKHNDYAKEIADDLKNKGFRLELDDRDESVGKKIREAELEKVPYMLILGDKEIENKTVAVRARGEKDLGPMSLDKFVNITKND